MKIETEKTNIKGTDQESRLAGVFTTGESRLPGVFTIGKSIFPVLFITGESFYEFLRACHKLYRDNIHKIDCGIVYLPHYWRFIFEKSPNLRNSNRLPSDDFTGESITNMNNSRNIRQNSFLGMPIGPRRSC
jgi:hypothetical protein